MSLSTQSPQIQEAIAKAKLAVEADNNNQLTEAINLYKKSIELIESEIPKLPQHYRTPLLKYAESYQKRVAILEEQLSTQALINSNQKEPFKVPVFEVPFNPAQPDLSLLGRLEPKPANATLVPFWLMRQLSLIMADGAFLTQKLYIPKEVWSQKGMRITAISAKISCCQALLSHITKLRQFDINEISLLKAIDLMLDEMGTHQNNLSKYLSFIEEQVSPPQQDAGGVELFSQKLKSIGHSIYKTAHRLSAIPTAVTNSDSYVQLLMDVFGESQIFGVWLLRCESCC
eukprot:c17963_g1_i1.p1 GENE.c17963_g1_i1~~c17963_g1_i1.p1  ORF type:complete len:287 (-),score=94.16 c17963_g1_i1:13-873(-)